MAIGAHPDDVELGAGGTLARWIAEGCEVTAVVCTGGGVGGGESGQSPAAIEALRKAEQRAAADRLGIGRLVMLGYPDGELDETREFRGALVRLIREYRPEVVLTHDPHRSRHFLHRDHRIVGQVVHDAIYPYARDPLHYPEQIENGLMTHRCDRLLFWDCDEANAIVDVSATLALQCAALGEHKSQLPGLFGEAAPLACLDARARRAAEGQSFSHGESFRLLDAPP